MDPVFERLAGNISSAVSRCGELSCVLGFDGTVDVICKPVQERSGPGGDYRPFTQIRDFGNHVVAADGKSALVELAVQQEKIGGNGPIMANALAASGLGVDYIGALGHPEIHPAYREFAAGVRVHSLTAPAVTQALEFDNGKLMLTNLSTYEEVNAGRIRELVGVDKLRGMVAEAGLCCPLNWTCLPFLNGILDLFLDEILPGVEKDPQRIFFFDLADPSARSDENLRSVLERIGRFEEHGRTVLGMNLNEVQQVSGVLGVDPPEADPESLCAALPEIRSRLGIDTMMAHPVSFAACATADGSRSVAGPYTTKPKITTGAGDHLNAGFCLGLLLGLPAEEALALGVLFSGFYVRQARPPELSELPGFIEELGVSPESNPAD